VVSGVGDVVGQPRDAAENVLDCILTLAAHGCEGGELGDLLLEALVGGFG
jgi:hypothetical protein